MPYVLIFLGIAIAYLDYLGAANLQAAGSQLYSEMFSGNQPFYKWAGAIVIIGAIGYIPEMQPIAMGFLVLILLGLILSNRSGFVSVIQGV
jgi:hypothetical protein